MKRFTSWCVIALLVILWVIGALPVGVAAEALPDLVVTNLTFNGNGQVTPGTKVTATVTVQNIGNADADIITVSLYKVYHDGTGNSPQIRSVTDIPYKMNLRTGASMVLESKPWVADAGDYMLVAIVNDSKRVQESSYTNNSIQRNLRVANDRVKPAYDSMQTILQKAGMTELIFNDDFNDPNSVDNTKSKEMGFKWYLTRPYGAPDLDGNDYSVKNGVMTVKNVTPTYNYGLGTVDTDSHEGFTFNTGYLEVKLRIPRPRENTEGEKGVPAIWALPPEKLYGSDRHWVELDWMEYWGDNYYTVCLHEIKAKASGEKEMWYTNGNTSYSGLGDGEWHVMGWLWQDGLFITYYDGVEKKRVSYTEDSFPDPMYTLKEGMMDIGAFVHLDGQQMPIIIGGSQDNPMELDYVRVWDGDTKGTYDPAEDVEEPPVHVDPFTAEEFIYNFTTDQYGDPIKTVTWENRSSILDGASAWESLSEPLKKEINTQLSKNGQASYEAMLAAAKAVKAPSATKPNGTTATPNKTTKAQKTTKAPAVTTAKKPASTTALGSAPTTQSTTVQEESTLTTTLPTEQGGTQPSATLAQEGEQPPKNNAVGIIVAVAAVLVLGGATAGVLIWYKRKKNS